MNIYGDGGENVDRRSPEVQIERLQLNKSKNMTPHMMLEGDDPILVNASSSFDIQSTSGGGPAKMIPSNSTAT